MIKCIYSLFAEFTKERVFMRKIKIVSDSSSDLKTLDGIAFATAPLKIITASKQYVDDESLDVEEMTNDLFTYKGKSSTSCPSIGDWLEAFDNSDWIFCVTITGTLSGSYNSAMNAKRTYEEEKTNSRVHVIDSLSTGPEIILIIEKLRALIGEGLDFDEICDQIEEYRKKTGLLFMLESLKNLANNGRVSPIVAKLAGILGIRLVGKASDRGDLEPINKCRGEKNALETMRNQLKELGYAGGKLCITHCLNAAAAEALRNMLLSEFQNAEIQILPCRGLCSFYAERGGLLVGFEKT